jgi:hypothetical protein
MAQPTQPRPMTSLAGPADNEPTIDAHPSICPITRGGVAAVGEERAKTRTGAIPEPAFLAAGSARGSLSQPP